MTERTEKLLRRGGAVCKERVPPDDSVYNASPRGRALARVFATVALVAALTHGSVAAAQDTQEQFRFEAEQYVKLNELLRLRFDEYLTRATEAADFTSGHLEVDLDIGLKPFLRQKLRNLPDTHRGKYFSVRTGYAYIPTFGDGKEHRIVLEATARYPLPLDILLSDRNRGDLRWVKGAFLTRYRNRIMIERDFAIGSVKVTPYLTAEAYYDLAVDLWDRAEFSAGAQIPLGKRPVIEFYYLRRHNSHSTIQHVNRPGVIFQWHF